MGLRRFKITDLPPLLILHFKRFTANNFVEEKNPTIVNYPLRGIDLKDCRCSCWVSAFADRRGCSSTDVNDTSPKHSTLYDLVANITHESAAGTAREDTTWKVHVHTKAENGQDERWYQIQDLIVEEINKQVVFLGDTYIQVRSGSSCANFLLRLNHLDRFGNEDYHRTNNTIYQSTLLYQRKPSQQQELWRQSKHQQLKAHWHLRRAKSAYGCLKRESKRVIQAASSSKRDNVDYCKCEMYNVILPRSDK